MRIQNRIQNRLRFAVLVVTTTVLAGSLLGCSDSSPTDPLGPGRSQPLPAVPADYSGSWRGQTDDGRGIAFTVDNGIVTSLNVEVVVSMSSASGTCAYTLVAPAPAAIADGGFAAPVRSPAGIVYETIVRGRFASATTIQGTYDNFNANGMHCGGTFTIGTPVAQGAGTWNATKVG